jgi:predicted nucleotidyltransferase
MQLILNKDFRDFIECLNECNVRYLLVGGYAAIFYGRTRNTGDIDIWVKRNEDNYKKLVLAFSKFGMALFDMTKDNFLYHEHWDVFRYGRPPVAIDIMVKMSDFDFDYCYQNVETIIDGGVAIKIISLELLKKAKEKAGRHKDKEDLEYL